MRIRADAGPCLDQMNPLHIITPYLLRSHFNISYWYKMKSICPLCFPANILYEFLFFAMHVTYTSHHLFDFHYRFFWKIQLGSLEFVIFFRSLVTSSLSDRKILLSALILKFLCVFPEGGRLPYQHNAIRTRAHHGNWQGQRNCNFRELLSAWTEHVRNGAAQIEETGKQLAETEKLNFQATEHASLLTVVLTRGFLMIAVLLTRITRYSNSFLS
jgi:hypothetical protein